MDWHKASAVEVLSHLRVEGVRDVKVLRDDVASELLSLKFHLEDGPEVDVRETMDVQNFVRLEVGPEISETRPRSVKIVISDVELDFGGLVFHIPIGP